MELKEKESAFAELSQVRYLPYAEQGEDGMLFGLAVQTAGDPPSETCYSDLFPSAQDAAAFAALLNSNAVELCHLFDVLEDYLG